MVSAHASFCQNDGAGACSATLETGIYCAQFIQWAMGGVAPESVEGVNFRLHEVAFQHPISTTHDLCPEMQFCGEHSYAVLDTRVGAPLLTSPRYTSP